MNSDSPTKVTSKKVNKNISREKKKNVFRAKVPNNVKNTKVLVKVKNKSNKETSHGCDCNCNKCQKNNVINTIDNTRITSQNTLQSQLRDIIKSLEKNGITIRESVVSTGNRENLKGYVMSNKKPKILKKRLKRKKEKIKNK